MVWDVVNFRKKNQPYGDLVDQNSLIHNVRNVLTCFGKIHIWYRPYQVTVKVNPTLVIQHCHIMAIVTTIQHCLNAIEMWSNNLPSVKNWTSLKLLQTTFPCYSSLHSRTTLVCVPALLWSTTGLGQTPLDLPFDWTHAWPDMGSSCHSPVTYLSISHHLYLLVLSLFPAVMVTSFITSYLIVCIYLI